MVRYVLFFQTLLLITLTVVGCAGSHPKTDRGLSIHNLGDRYSTYWMEAKKIPDASIGRHVELFKSAMMSGEYSNLYQDTVFSGRGAGGELDKLLEKRLASTLPTLRAKEAEIAQNFSQFDEQVEIQIRRFSEVYPGFDFSELPIFAMVSLGGFLGGKRSFQGQTIIAFGMDELAKGGRSFPILFAHETFHAYHDFKSPSFRREMENDDEVIISAAFIEGLATFASGKLNPSIEVQKHHDLILRKWCETGKYRSHIGEFLNDAEKVSYKNFPQTNSIYAKWFYTERREDPGFPVMAGYCIGERVVAELAKTYSIQQMAAWSLDEFKAKAKAVLQSWTKNP